MCDKNPTTDCDCSHDHNETSSWKPYILPTISFVLLLAGLGLEHFIRLEVFTGWIKAIWYLAAYLPVGLPVLKQSLTAVIKGNFFTEFFLMSIATIGAFIIGAYPEGVAVMLFYAVGELFQSAAIKSAKANITALLDVRPKTAHVFRSGNFVSVDPETVSVGEKIQIKVGEKIPLDGQLLSVTASLNTAALTGESRPQSLLAGEKVLAGSINLDQVIEVEVEKLFNDSSVAKILYLVQNATSKKAKTELLIRRLAKIYTPIVVYLAIAIMVIPYFFVADYQFSDWFYRALVFLVISCPCALVISIPLGYFGGLGAASKNGILFKGATHMEMLTKINTLVIDKTGTVTKGTFTIKNIVIHNDLAEQSFMKLLLALEGASTHPIAKAIMQYSPVGEIPQPTEVQEIPGKGLKGQVGTSMMLAGNKKLLEQFNITVPAEIDSIVDSVVLVSIDSKFAGYVTIADEIKPDAKAIITGLKKLGISEVVMLSGDKDSITQEAARELGIKTAKGELLPEDKLRELEHLKTNPKKLVAFIGDGINDAPVLAASDIGVAMGAMGSDVAIETADMIIQTDEPSKFIVGYHISQSTQRVIWQNIILAFGGKSIVLLLGAFGLATMWAAVFADVGLSLLAILNAMRLQRMTWPTTSPKIELGQKT